MTHRRPASSPDDRRFAILSLRNRRRSSLCIDSKTEKKRSTNSFRTRSFYLSIDELIHQRSFPDARIAEDNHFEKNLLTWWGHDDWSKEVVEEKEDLKIQSEHRDDDHGGEKSTTKNNNNKHRCSCTCIVVRLPLDELFFSVVRRTQRTFVTNERTPSRMVEAFFPFSNNVDQQQRYSNGMMIFTSSQTLVG